MMMVKHVRGRVGKEKKKSNNRKERIYNHALLHTSTMSDSRVDYIDNKVSVGEESLARTCQTLTSSTDRLTADFLKKTHFLLYFRAVGKDYTHESVFVCVCH